MAFALVEFADKSLAVVETANITTAAGEKVTDCGQDCVVEWRGPGKKKKVATKHAATVIKFGGANDLRLEMKRLIEGKNLTTAAEEVTSGRGCRDKKRKLSTSSDEEGTKESQGKKKKTVLTPSGRSTSREILERIKKRREAEDTDNSATKADDVPGEDTIEQLKHRCQQLEAENKNVKATLAAIDVLPRIVKQLQTLASSSTAIPAPTRTSVPTPHPPTTAAEHGHAPQLQPSHTSSSLSTTAANHDDCTSTDKIKNVAAGASRQSAAKMTNDIMHGMYSGQYMATHCLTGNEKEDKGALPSTDVTRIIEEVRVVFASVTTTEVRSYIRQKLSNAVKIMKKKEKTQGND